MVHFNALAKYPPPVNCLRFLAATMKGFELTVITTKVGISKWQIDIPGVNIVYGLNWEKQPSKIKRMLGYISFNIRALLILMRKKPASILYYETLSAWAPGFYKKHFNKNTRLFIHYHEYSTPEEYAGGMWMNNYFHQKEIPLYKQADWVSHTNADRMQLFVNDLGKDAPGNTGILPNYPPASWATKAATVPRAADERIGFVYVGVLSLSTMYTREMAQWVAAHPDRCYWDIYSDLHDQDALDFLKNLDAPNIHFKGALAYDELPSVLPQYDIGVILYKGTTQNYTFNAPNKFFEYHICGLNVLYPPVMKGMHPYRQQDKKPWVAEVDFDNPVLPAAGEARRTSPAPATTWTAENIYAQLQERLSANN